MVVGAGKRLVAVMQITPNYLIQAQITGHYILQICLFDKGQEGILNFGRVHEFMLPIPHHSLFMFFRKSLGQETEETSHWVLLSMLMQFVGHKSYM